MKQSFEQIRNVEINPNNLNKPSKKKAYQTKKDNYLLSKHKFKTSNPVSITTQEINLLFFENNNINPNLYFRNLRKEQQKIISQNSQTKNKNNLNINNINQQLNLKTLDLNNQEKPDTCSNIINSSFSSNFSDSEEDDEETKMQREEIIKKLCKRIDEIKFDENFNIFDFSKMINICEIPILRKEKKDKMKNQEIENSKLSTDKSESNIELIKTAVKKKDLKRGNKFQRNIKREKNDKSKSIDRKKERSRSNSWKISYF